MLGLFTLLVCLLACAVYYVRDMVHIGPLIPEGLQHSQQDFNLTVYKEPKLSKTLPKYDKHTVFIGRETELKRLVDCVQLNSNTSIVSITGPPGFGKSTLAIHAGYEAEKLGYTVMYVDIAEAHNMKQVIDGLLSSANAEEQTSFQDLTSWIWSINKTTLVIFDNCDLILLDNKDDFQSLLKTLCQKSMNVSIIFTAKEITFFLGAYEHIHIEELETKSAVLVLRKTSPKIDNGLAYKLVKRIGNVPLALQVIGMLIKSNLYEIDEILSAINRDIVDTTSPQEFPSKDRMETTLNVSFQYLPVEVQFCGQVLSYIPGSFTTELAQFILPLYIPVVRIFHYSNYTVNEFSKLNKTEELQKWEDKATKHCLDFLTKRSLLSKHNGRYKFHQLVKDYFYRYHKTRKEKCFSDFRTDFKARLVNQSTLDALVALENMTENVVMLGLSIYCAKQLILHFQHTFNITESQILAAQYYTNFHEDFLNCKAVFPMLWNTRQIIEDTRYYLKYTVLDLKFMKKVNHREFNTILLDLYKAIPTLESDSIKDNYIQVKGSVHYFSTFVKLVILLGRMETLVYNSSYSLKTLWRKSQRIYDLYNQTCENNSTKSHTIFAKYYAALATKYLYLNDFEAFIQFWQKSLHLRTFTCKSHTCTKVQIGQQAFSKRDYKLAVLNLKPYLYSRNFTINMRARMFVIVLYSYIQLGQQKEAKQLLHKDVEPILNVREVDSEIVEDKYTFGSYGDTKQIECGTVKILQPLSQGFFQHLWQWISPDSRSRRKLEFPTITQELYYTRLLCNLRLQREQQGIQCRECRTLIIFERFLKQYFKEYQTIQLILRKKVSQYVNSLVSSVRYGPQMRVYDLTWHWQYF